MGVSGCGKTTLGTLVAKHLDCPFVEGDEFHPPENVEKMREGYSLNDDDRAGWLESLARKISHHRKTSGHSHLCLSCSALKKSYRDVLRTGDPSLLLVHLHGDRKTLEDRVEGREHEYMPASLLDSQLESLEIPGEDERCLVVRMALPLPEQLRLVLKGMESKAS